jgi:hypothetical protein
MFSNSGKVITAIFICSGINSSHFSVAIFCFFSCSFLSFSILMFATASFSEK